MSVGDFIDSATLSMGQLQFVPVLGFEGTSSFDFLVNDGNRDSFFADTVMLDIGPTNVAPQFTTNISLEVAPGSDGNVIGTNNLAVEDVDNEVDELVLVINPAAGSGPINGILFNGGNEVQPGDPIPYVDLLAGQLTYSHTVPGTTTDTIRFLLSDGIEGLSLIHISEPTRPY